MLRLLEFICSCGLWSREEFSAGPTYSRTIVDSPSCTSCGYSEETTERLLFHCGPAAQFWSAIGASLPQMGIRSSDIHTAIKINTVPAKQHSKFIALCCWQLWKRRNGIVFRNESLYLWQLLLSCKAEAKLWRARLPRRQKPIADNWCRLFEASIESAM